MENFTTMLPEHFHFVWKMYQLAEMAETENK